MLISGKTALEEENALIQSWSLTLPAPVLVFCAGAAPQCLSPAISCSGPSLTPPDVPRARGNPIAAAALLFAAELRLQGQGIVPSALFILSPRGTAQCWSHCRVRGHWALRALHPGDPDIPWAGITAGICP